MPRKGRKDERLHQPKFDPNHPPVKPPYPSPSRVWRSAEEYNGWENQCERLRNQWKKDIEDWKALYITDSDWEDWGLEEEGGENLTAGLEDPQWGPQPTYAAVSYYYPGLGPDDPRATTEQLEAILPALAKLLGTYHERPVGPTVSNVGGSSQAGYALREPSRIVITSSSLGVKGRFNNGTVKSTPAPSSHENPIFLSKGDSYIANRRKPSHPATFRLFSPTNMKPFQVDPRLIQQVGSAYPCPTVAHEFLRKIASDVLESRMDDEDFSFPQYGQTVSEALQCSSFRDMAEPGTGLPNRIHQPHVHTTLGGPVVLELVHLTDVGVSAMALENARQRRERRLFLDELACRSDSYEGQVQRDLEWLKPGLEEYPRKRLKLFLSDGTVEIQAIELERLEGLALGTTPMGTKVHLENVEVVGGIAYLRNAQVTILGGVVEGLQKAHRTRLYEELSQRMREEAAEAHVQGLSPEGLYRERRTDNSGLKEGRSASTDE
ncbi:hypothetical protein FA13DRAFT_1790048 [Coprinellus micaceus]|uniref:RecQ-mediated genome instability protein 1 n=1 Tax=Coprinellus micaceus TaxID=71717 RepID=A0A4Y7THC1_COPMI|nr:hypothetical protein FA13DRAFT_1790048 [Coprinellus micaceus]